MAGAVSLGGDHACYVPVVDRIHLPDRLAFHSVGALYFSWSQEAFHSTGHCSRLARDISGGMRSSPMAVAPLPLKSWWPGWGLLLGDRLAIGSDMAIQATYLGHWVELLKESPRVLLLVLSDALRAEDLICPDLAGCA